jgi:uncharacterized SAM-binding protein YcdF (DUF218 family)
VAERAHRPAAGRVALTVAVAALTALTLLLVPAAMLLSDEGWRTAARELADPAPASPAPDGPVLVLGGSDTRLPHALALVEGLPGPTRPLWLSAGTAEQWEAMGRTCDEPHVVCLTPDPASTYGEALAARRLAAGMADGEVLTVVTSGFHVARTRWQFAACAGVPTVVVAPGAGPSPDDQAWAELVKLVNAGLRTACRGALA